jgi:RES domain-containing protein
LLEEKRMFNVGNNLLSPPLPGIVPGALPGSANAAGYGSLSGATAADGISSAAQPPGGAPAPGWPWFGGGNGAGGFINQFMSTIFAAFTQLAQYLTSMFGTPPWGQTWFPPYGGGPSPSPAPGPGPAPQQRHSVGDGKQQYFTSADFRSTGDPHDAFAGTTASGETVGGRWNNMLNHPDLLHSNSFAGGFRISTDVGQPNDRGVTRNNTATVETNYGRTAVTMSAGGSFSVTENGKSIELEAGKTQDLGHGESVTLNKDGSLTVVDRSASGGEITTTLSAKNGGVNVEASAQNVDLGGYLVRHSEKMSQPSLNASAGSGTPSETPGLAAWPGAPSVQSTSPQPYQAFQPYQPYEPFGSYQPSPAAEVPSIDTLLGA